MEIRIYEKVVEDPNAPRSTLHMYPAPDPLAGVVSVCGRPLRHVINEYLSPGGAEEMLDRVYWVVMRKAVYNTIDVFERDSLREAIRILCEYPRTGGVPRVDEQDEANLAHNAALYINHRRRPARDIATVEQELRAAEAELPERHRFFDEEVLSRKGVREAEAALKAVQSKVYLLTNELQDARLWAEVVARFDEVIPPRLREMLDAELAGRHVPCPLLQPVAGTGEFAIANAGTGRRFA